jgi:putative cardiolipin synthase
MLPNSKQSMPILKRASRCVLRVRRISGAQRWWLRVMALLIAVSTLPGCTLPLLEPRTQSVSLTVPQAASTKLGRAVADDLATHVGLTGVFPLEDPLGSFAARMDLARAAQRTLDVQYYIWRDDLTGTLLLEALREAADRGVHVRLLLDDFGVPASLDSTLVALNAHPFIEVRLFNPFAIRKPKSLGFLTDFRRVNRRMHNKSFTADSTVTIVGGRNIGDEYYGATDGVVFADLDVLTIGQAAVDVADDFDRYWASASSYPIDRLLRRTAADQLDALDRKAKAIEVDPAAQTYVNAMRGPQTVQQILDGTLQFEWAKTQLISDDPAKALNNAPPEALIGHQLRSLLGEPTREVDLISPYFVPTTAGTKYFTQLTARDIVVRVLTNSLEATDVPAVHSGYAKRRVELLQGGVHLYEMRRSPGDSHEKEESAGPFGSSGSSLHAKTFAVDGKRVFVGSFNFDPRSANLNTELGLVVDSPVLAGRIESVFATRVPQVAYEVRLDSNGKLYWLEHNGDNEVRHDTEPNTTWFGRLGIWMLSILPIESLL